MAKAGSKLTLTAVSASPWYVLDPHVCPFEATVLVGVSGSGAVTSDIDIQGTLVDVIGGVTPGTVDIFELVSAQSATMHFSLTKPVTAIRMNVVALVTGGRASMTVLQSGN